MARGDCWDRVGASKCCVLHRPLQASRLTFPARQGHGQKGGCRPVRRLAPRGHRQGSRRQLVNPVLSGGGRLRFVAHAVEAVALAVIIWVVGIVGLTAWREHRNQRDPWPQTPDAKRTGGGRPLSSGDPAKPVGVGAGSTRGRRSPGSTTAGRGDVVRRDKLQHARRGR
jgi:hypothetical protein